MAEHLTLKSFPAYQIAGEGWQNIFATSSGNYDEGHVISRLLAVLAHDTVPISLGVALTNALTNTNTDESEVDFVTIDREFSPGEYPSQGEPRYVVGISRYGEDVLEAAPADRQARADGLIQLIAPDKSPVLTVIIEAKRGSNSLSAEQLNRYETRFNADSGFRTRSWGDVCKTLHTVALGLGDSTAGVLVRELTAFLWEQEVGKRFGATEYDDGGVIPEHRFWWEVRRGNNGPEVRIVDEYRPQDSEDIDMENVDSVSELYDTYTSSWYDETELDSLFNNIPERVLNKSLLNPPTSNKSRLEVLTDWAQKARQNGELHRENFAGNPRRGIGEFQQGGQIAQLHLGLDGSPVLKFHTYKGNGQWGSPLTLTEHEFETVIEAMPRDVRHALLVERDFSVLDKFLEFR
ncbi:hypothetical protein [Halorussus sp. AFM4]|uniref:hypothetical protein n=1 Tax=Halorussus sp. AFM4 TaxID=3421651 RepID=UPI003EC058A5